MEEIEEIEKMIRTGEVGGKKKGDFIGERTIKFRRSRREGLFGERNRKWGRKIEEGRREERTERTTNKNPHRTLFLSLKRSIFCGQRVFGVWIWGQDYKSVESIERRTNKNPHRTLFLGHKRSIFCGRRVFGVWIL